MQYCQKIFLSDHYDESGTMVVKAASDRQEDLSRYGAESPSVEASVQFRDCYNEPISLDFRVTSDRRLEKRLAKLDVMIFQLQQLKEQLPVFWEDAKVQAQTWLDANPKGEGDAESAIERILNGDDE